MIYISTSCVKADTIKDSIEKLLKKGFKNIELSGGTEYYDDLQKDLINFKKNNDVNFLLHNYFPPPKKHFVLNLASLNKKTFNMSIEHYKKSLDISNNLEAKIFGLHAGFLVDPNLNELGKSIEKKKMYNKSKAIDQFCNGLEHLLNYAPDIRICVENNVFSDKNKKTFESNPFLFTDYDSYIELSEKLDFNILLDVAHLKVSCKSLSLPFLEQLNNLAQISDYIHISDNDALSDSNKYVTEDSEMYKALSKINLKGKILTLEIYEDLTRILSSYKLFSNPKIEF